MTNSARVSHGSLLDFATQILLRSNVPPDDAKLVADSLIQADLWGHQSHGILRLPWYLARINSGVMRAETRPELAVDAGAVAVIDGHDGIGQVLAHGAMLDAVIRSRRHGIGAVAVRNSNHFGAALYFTRMAARENCIGFLSTNASPAMAPWGGRKKLVGTNPWSIAAPISANSAMALDIANTGVARGKIYLAKQYGLPIPPGWAMTVDGEPTTDPVAAIAGLILPMAEHKGYAIAVMMDMLSGVLSGSAFGADVAGPYQSERKSGCGHLAIALDIAAFQPLTEFKDRVQRQIAQLKSSPLAKGFEEIFYPGEIEERNDALNRQQGLMLPQETLNELGRLSLQLGVPLRL